MAGMFTDYEDPEYVPGAGQGLSPLSLEAASKYAQDLARFGKGAVTGTAGALGDIESGIRGVRSVFNPQPGSTVLNSFLYGLNQPTVLPTSSDVNKAINPYMPSFMAGEATTPQQIGEFVSLGGLLTQAAKRVPSLVRATENVPVGLSVKPLQSAEKSQLGFYSAVQDAATNLQRNSGSGQAFLNDIKKGANVKDEEIKWMGLDEFLSGKKNVTKQEVQDYIANNKVDVQEVALGASQNINTSSKYATPEVLRIVNQNQGSIDNAALLALDNDYAAYKEITTKFPELRGNPDWAEVVLKDVTGTTQNLENLPKFGQYTLPGGENYRELLLTLPTKRLSEEEARMVLGAKPDAKLSDADIAYASRKQVDEYKSGHWDEPNVLAHIRVNDRVDADGKKMLLVEEVQSDWHQTGRDKGYATGKEEKAYVDYLKGLEARVKNDIVSKFISDGATPERAEILSTNLVKGLAEDPRKLAAYFGEEAKQMELHKARIAAREGVPDAPFKDTWYQLALKRALQFAAENGYDRVGLTTGARQAERYNLSKYIDNITYEPTDKGFYIFVKDKKGADVLHGNYSEKELEGVIGKEAAKKIANNEGKPYSPTKNILEGLDLQVGGEGMKKYYDEVYPKFLAKYGKKWDAKVGETTIEVDGGAETTRYIDITPKMKENVTQAGQPLFSVAAPIGAGALTYEQLNQTGLENPLLK